MFGALFRSSPEKYPALTGTRAIAAYLVFFHHFAGNPQVSGRLSGIFGECHVGVTLFYVLSGFLITYNYSQKADLSKGFWFKYVSRRIGKIYPLYIFLLALTYVLQILMKGTFPSKTSLLLNFTLWKGFFEDFKFDGIGQSWSLTVEETFYFLAPFLFIAVRRVGLVATQILLYGIGGLLLLLGSNISFYGFFSNFRFVALYTFFGRSFEFMLGMTLAHTLLKHPNLLAVPGRLKLTHLGLGGGVLVVFWMSLLRRPGEFGLYHPFGMVLNNLVLPIFVGVLFCGLMSELTLIGRILSSAPFVFFGRTSYAFYLVHLGILEILINSRTGSLGVRLRVGVLFVAANAVSAILFLLVEKPANSLIRNWADKLVERKSRVKKPANPGLRLRRGALVWTCLFTIAFAIWGVHGLDFSSFSAFMSSARGETSQIRIDIPQFAHPISGRTDFAHITSRVERNSQLTYTVSGKSIAEKNFIFAHANSRLEYILPNGKWSKLEFSAGLDDVNGADLGSVVYIVRGDGNVLFTSPVIQALEPPYSFVVSVAGVRRLELIITDAGNGTTSDEAYWIQPLLR